MTSERPVHHSLKVHAQSDIGGATAVSNHTRGVVRLPRLSITNSQSVDGLRTTVHAVVKIDAAVEVGS